MFPPNNKEKDYVCQIKIDMHSNTISLYYVYLTVEFQPGLFFLTAAPPKCGLLLCQRLYFPLKKLKIIAVVH